MAHRHLTDLPALSVHTDADIFHTNQSLTDKKTTLSQISDYVWTEEFDLIVDSDAKLDLWCQAVAGEYKRVLIRAGTWTASALSPTAGVLVNLTAAGTVYVRAEKDAVVEYSGAYAGIMYGFWRTALLADEWGEKFENIKIVLTNTNQTAAAFRNCSNLIDCQAFVVAGTIAYSYYTCKRLRHCYGSAEGVTGCQAYNACWYLDNCKGMAEDTGTSAAVAFNGCFYLLHCRGEVLGTGGNDYAYNSCYDLVNCYGVTSEGVNSVAFFSCLRMSQCEGYSGGNTANDVVGMLECSGVVSCRAQGVNSGAGNGYGFKGCTKMQQNAPAGGSKTATYNISYADTATANPCADTAAGGYNNP